jgi:phage terminase large subunit
MKQIVNKKYAEVFTNKKVRYVILLGGRGAGRSTVISQYLLASLVSPDYMRSAIMRAVHSDIRHSSWKEIRDRISEQDIEKALTIRENEMGINYGANSIQAHGFRASSSSYSAKLKSLASYNVVWIEEAEEVGEDEFKTLDDTLRTKKGNIVIFLTLNPPSKSHWIIRRWFDLENAYEEDGSLITGFYKPKLKEGLDDVLFINTSYLDNKANLDAHTLKRYEEYKNSDPSYYYQKIKGLVPDTVRGKIYSGWKIIDEIPHEARLVSRGLDFGWFPDPAGLVNIYYYNGGYILDQLAYGTEIKNQTLAEIIQNDGQRALTYADSAEPKSIQEIKDYGIDIVGVEKGKDSVSYGIKVVSGQRISVTRRSKDLWEAYENYAWDEDKDGNPKGKPNHYKSDLMDAVRYGLVSIIDGGTDPDRREKEEIQVLVNRDEYKRQQARKFMI